MVSIFQSDAGNILRAMSRSFAVIEFDVTGKIRTANENFCEAVGYPLAEIVGQHHKMFVESDYSRSEEYNFFWKRLAAGEFVSSLSKRIAKGGRELWLQASYNAVSDSKGRIYKVVKFASDVTAATQKSIEDAGKLNALTRSQAIIEFTPAGNIIRANENFLNTLGYKVSEIEGQHHSMFVDPVYARSREYAEFWNMLRKGEYQAADFKRFGKGGREVWIQASYNPIVDDQGVVIKVVKFATDLTDRMKAVESVGAALGRLAGGDLDQHLDKAFIPSLETLRVNFNESVVKLNAAMRSVSDNATVIHSGADQVRTAADDLARRTEQQAAAIEQTSAALSEITNTVKLSSKRADEAGVLVSKTKADAEHSGLIVGQAVAAMSRIEDSSDKISKIIGVIDEIAFQTNLLALNAGVEAARAGEAGRGFAVVAQEVRGLAQRSAEAAREIKELISTSGKQVEDGVRLVSQAGGALEAIGVRVAEINDHVVSIVESARSQSLGLQDINAAVGTLDHGTQQNAAMVEESTAASNELAGEARALTALLGNFTLGDVAVSRLVSPVHQLNTRVHKAFGIRA